MIKLLSYYSLKYPFALVYMLQTSDYRTSEYTRWLKRVKDFRGVAHRQKLALTNKAKLLVSVIILMILLDVTVGMALLSVGLSLMGIAYVVSGVVLIALYPWLVAYGIIVPLKIGEVLIQRPRERQILAEATEIVSKHQAFKIAIAGSYGKTTFKEMLATVIGEQKIVAATPGNMNTPLGTSRFVKNLNGKEDIIIFELGESMEGDVMQLAQITHPEIGVITGINQAHLETFGTIEQTVKTIFELRDYLGDKPLYKNKQSRLVAENIESTDPLAYDGNGVNGWRVGDVSLSLDGVRFRAVKGDKSLEVESGLLGAHQVGPLMACLDIADRIGMSIDEIAAGMKKTVPFEHRMQPRKLHGAWIIDDTYNGNIQGIEAGLAFIDAIEATRKIYVTPGLVEQGDDTAVLHRHIGELIARSCTMVILMKNSTTKYILEGLEVGSFTGEVKVIDDPLKFYTSIEQFVAAGDVVLMQNDWTDNYA